MRPINLVVRAFGPYADEQNFDFRELGARSFFLIHGPTGSGKTTILDAMSFALYGDTSGNERDGKQMRSDMADPARLTEVVFDFSLGQETYRVARSPEQERPKQRGEGTTTERPKATLWRRTGLANDNEEGFVLAAQWSEVTRAVADLLGFESDQFRQVVLLPQGQFRRLLVSSSADREEILERLFQTEFLRAIEDRLKAAAKERQDRMKETRQAGKSVRDQAEVESLAELETRRAETAARVEELAGRIASLRETESKALDTLTRGRETARRFTERDEARAALAAIEQRADAVDAVRVQLARARAAATLLDAEANLAALVRDSDDARHAVDAARAAHAAAIETLAQAARRFDDEEGREPEREAARNDLSRLEALRATVAELDAATRELAVAIAAAAEAETTHKKIQADLVTLEGRIEKGTRMVADAEKAAAELAGRESGLRETDAMLQRRRRLDEETAVHAKEIKKLESIQRDLAAAEASLVAAREDLARVESAWAVGQAALLARDLEDGAPCPVCGSKDHPAPARAAGEVPGEEQVREQRKAVETLEKNRDELRKRESDEARSEAEMRSRIEGLRADLGPRAETPRSQLESDAAQAKTALEDARKRAGQLQRCQDLLNEVDAQRGEAKRALAESESMLAGARQKRDLARGRVAQREADVPADLREPGALTTALERAAGRVRSLREAHEKARAGKSAAETTLARRDAESRNAADRADAAARRVDAAGLAFDTRLVESGFRDAAGAPDRVGFESVKPSIARVGAMEKEIAAHESALESARDRHARATDGVEGLTQPDLIALETAHATARAAVEEKSNEHGAFRQRLNQMDRWIAALRDAETLIAKLDAEYAVVGRLADVANGGNARRVSFQRFVLGALLDDVLVAASHRLTLMSKGRYTLQRQAERSDKRSAGGLDLEVLDAYTGEPRPVETLSGGEGFLASLSLALGLADVVQAYAGGIRLETIFVDEGFGSLDSESLDLALRALIDLQQGGRLVGIISHVPELKERIDARLEILPDRRGSRAWFVVP